MTTVDGVGNSPGKINMVVFQQNHIKKTDAMVHAPTQLYSLLLQHTHTRCSLAGVENMTAGAGDAFHIFMCHGSDTAHALHDVEHQTLSLQERTRLTRNDHGNVALLHRLPIANEHLHLQSRIETVKHFLCYLDTGKYTVFLDKQMAFAHGIRWNTAQSGMVSITDILSKSQVDEFVF